jgi:CRISPR/Cas system CMR-associated protein Cmr5 small subunit
MKNHVRDYATEAFRFYARNGKSADRYKQKIYDEALEEQKKVEGSSGISDPTPAAIMRAESAVNAKIAEIEDMEAVELTIRELEVARNCKMKRTIEIVYFSDADKKLEKGDIHNRVCKAELDIPASEKTIYRWLSKARKIFAENRGLRI